eukprot:4029927-Pleurochrysis_carterae.AAC.1
MAKAIAEQFAMEKKGKAAKLSHIETAGSAAAASASAPNGALPGASAAPNTVDRPANFGKGEQMPPPLPPADVDRNSLRNELIDRLMYGTALQLEQDYDTTLLSGGVSVGRGLLSCARTWIECWSWATWRLDASLATKTAATTAILHLVQLLTCLIRCWSISQATCEDADSWARTGRGCSFRSRDICPALYRQQLGLDCDRLLCVKLHTNVEADASEPHNHFEAVSVHPTRISDAEFAVLLDAWADP